MAAVASESVAVDKRLDVAVYHDGPKENWSLRLRPSTSVVWIGDSNSRRIRNVPIGWEVHAYSGARFSHIVQLLRQVVNNSLLKLKTVIIAAGINHRDDGDHRCVAQLRELHAVVNFLDNMGIHTTVIGVSYPTTLGESAQHQIDKVNKWLQDEVPTANYIAPL